MLKFKDSAGKQYTGVTYARVVKQMKASSWIAGSTKSSYMDGVRSRLKSLGTTNIHSNSPKDFILSLEKQGWLRRVKPRKLLK